MKESEPKPVENMQPTNGQSTITESLNSPSNDERLRIFIPKCCEEGWDSCPHVIHPEPPVKGNIGM